MWGLQPELIIVPAQDTHNLILTNQHGGQLQHQANNYTAVHLLLGYKRKSILVMQLHLSLWLLLLAPACCCICCNTSCDHIIEPTAQYSFRLQQAVVVPSALLYNSSGVTNKTSVSSDFVDESLMSCHCLTTATGPTSGRIGGSTCG